jgi:hypothetical protein
MLWEIIKWGIVAFFGIFYSSLILVILVRIFRAVTSPVDEIEMIDFINSKNKAESLRSWEERDS